MYLVIDVGTSGIRAAAIATTRDQASIAFEVRRPFPPHIPFSGGVEFDASELARISLELAREVIGAVGPVRGVGIANQRASTVVWDRTTGEPIGHGLGWQDLRTLGACLELNAKGHRVPPNASVTKIAALLDAHDANRSRDLCFGTVDSWLIWTLTNETVHSTDATNAGSTAMVVFDGTSIRWDHGLTSALNIPPAMLPTIVNSSGFIAQASALPGSPPILAAVGDQQASLVGQGCVDVGQAKITFGTGAMLDVCLGSTPPKEFRRTESGTIPIITWQRSGAVNWGTEAIMLAAGSCVDWLRDDMGLITSAEQSESVAAQCESSGGVMFVPSLLGLATPTWDYGARGTVVGMTRGTGRPELARAVLEGVAHGAVDMVDAAEREGGFRIESLRVDGGMSRNQVFTQALADASGRPVVVSSVTEATCLGAGLLAALADDAFSSMAEVGAAPQPSHTVTPQMTDSSATKNRERWAEATRRAARWIPGLSALDF
jgi:glycerol kinase